MIPREQVYQALFNRFGAVPGFATASRKLKHWGEVSPEEQPALFMAQKNELGQPVTGLPTRWTFSVDLYLYAWSGGIDTPASILNPLVDAIVGMLDPDNPIEGKCTLGGLVQHAWIDGEIQTDEGVLGDQAVAIIPIHVLVS